MTGVEILNVTTVYEIERLWWIIPLYAGIGLLIGLIVSIYEWSQCGFDSAYIALMIALTIGCGFVGIIGTELSEKATDVVDYIEYKVIIDDSVLMTEFMEKYEILDQEGKIYTVREKN